MISFQVDVLDGTAATLHATAYVDVPKVGLEVTQAHNVAPTCDPAPASILADQIFVNPTKLVSSLGFDAFAVGTETEFFELEQQHEGFNKSWTVHNFPTACTSFNPAQKKLDRAFKTGSTKGGSATSHRGSVAGVLLAMILTTFMIV